jgi:tetratricopeptide (TPR) repeat protein
LKQPGGERDGKNWLKLAGMYEVEGRYNDAERAYRRAIQLIGTQDPGVLADSMDLLGMLYAQEGKLKRAEETEQAALEMREAHGDRLGIGLSWMNLAMISLGEHRVGEATRYAEWAVDRLVPATPEKQSQESIEQQMTALIYLSEVREAEGDYPSALVELGRARKIGEGKYSASSFPLAYIDFLLGYAHWKNGEPDLAAELMKEGATGIQAGLGWRHPTCVRLMVHYAAFLKQTQRRAEAAELRKTMARARDAERSGQTSAGAMAAFSP